MISVELRHNRASLSICVVTNRIAPFVEVLLFFYLAQLVNLSKGVEQKGFQRGIEQGIQQEREAGTLRSIQNLMDTLHLTAEQAMDALKVDTAKRSIYVEKLKMN